MQDFPEEAGNCKKTKNKNSTAYREKSQGEPEIPQWFEKI